MKLDLPNNLVLKLYIIWSVIADLIVVGGIIWLIFE